MTPNKFCAKKLEERKQEEIRSFKVKAEYLKLTLKGLQNMLDTEKEKLMREKGEVEGLAKEKGLILLEPEREDHVCNRDPQKISFPSHSQTYLDNVIPTMNPVGQTERNFDTNHLEGQIAPVDLGQGDAGRTSFNILRDDCFLSPGIDWEPQSYGDYSSAMWSGPLQEDCYAMSFNEQRDLVPEQIFNSGYLDQTLYQTLPDDNYPFYDYNDGMNSGDFTPNYLQDPELSSLTSQQHLFELLKEVDHINQAIKNLENE